MENKSPLSETKPSLDLSTVPFAEPKERAFSAYANVVNCNWTLTDVRLRFAELIYIRDEENPIWANNKKVLMEKVAITIPWLQAKVLRDMLTGIIESYESKNGELKNIELPPVPGAE